MGLPNLPIQVPASVRQGSEEGYEEVMPGRDQGLTRTYRGRKRDEISDGGGTTITGHMIGNEALDVDD